MNDERRSPPPPSALAALGLSVWLLAACSDDACPTLKRCDIRTEACQSHTARVAACLRGGEPVVPEVEVVDREAFIESEIAVWREAPRSEAARALEEGLALFGLMPWNYDEAERLREYWASGGAFYSRGTGRVTVLDGGRPLDGAGAVTLLLHEIIHAMQFAEIENYYELFGGTFDRALALTAVIEGEAVLYQDHARLLGFGVDPDDVDWDGVFDGFEGRMRSEARQSEFPVFHARRLFPYAFGGAYMSRAFRDGGNDAVRAVFLDPPPSTREILGGYGASSPRGTGWVDGPDEVGQPVLPPELQHAATRRLGAWVFEVFRHRWAADPDRLDAGDPGLAGDVLTVFHDPVTLDVTGVWRLRFDETRQAEEFLDNFDARFWVAAVQEERDVVLVASTDESLPGRLVASMEWRPAPESDFIAEEEAAPAQRSTREPSSRD